MLITFTLPERPLQIAVFGSAQDLKYGADLEKLAEEVGFWIAKSSSGLIYGAEKDYDSLSTAACRGARKGEANFWQIMGVTYGKGKEVKDKDLGGWIMPTGMERGGGREFVLGCTPDATIGLSGGSGTLNELVVAYQQDIPLIGLKGTGGRTDEFIGRTFDSRRPWSPLYEANSPKEAVELACYLGARYLLLNGFRAYVNPDAGLDLNKQIVWGR